LFHGLSPDVDETQWMIDQLNGVLVKAEGDSEHIKKQLKESIADAERVHRCRLIL